MPDPRLARPFSAYQGRAPFIFVSYAHRDSHIVYPELSVLFAKRYRIWYDEGIPAGSSWTDEIAAAIGHCALFIVFLSPASAASENVQDEIHHALEKGRKILAIYLEDTNLKDGDAMRLNRKQALLKHSMSKEEYWRKLLEAIPAETIATYSEPYIAANDQTRAHGPAGGRTLVPENGSGSPTKSFVKFLPLLLIPIAGVAILWSKGRSAAAGTPSPSSRTISPASGSVGASTDSAAKDCLENIKNCALAMKIYSADCDDVLPNGDWHKQLLPYTNSERPFTCPTVEQHGGQGGYAATSELKGTPLSAISGMDSTVLLRETDHLGLGVWETKSTESSSQAYRHSNKMSVATADGHASLVAKP